MRFENPNLRTIGISKKEWKGFKLDDRASERALQELSNSAFKMWFYFARNRDGHEMDLYAVDVMNKCTMSRTTYHNAFKELCEKGYLKPVSGKKNYYVFADNPK